MGSHGEHPDFPMAMSEAEVAAVVREVTDEEVTHYHEYVRCLRMNNTSSNNTPKE